MKANILIKSSLLGILTSLIIIPLAYLTAITAGFVFPPFRLFDFVSRSLPGNVITTVIETMVGIVSSLNVGNTSTVAKLVEQSMALLQFILVGGIFGAVMGYLGSKTEFKNLPIWAMVTGLIISMGFILVEMNLQSSAGTSFADIVWQVMLFGGWGLGLGWLIQETALAVRDSQKDEKISRRELLYLGGTTLGALIMGALGFGVFIRNRNGVTETASETGPTPPADERFANRIEPAPGTRPEITSNQNFYRVDINTVPPKIDAATWQLQLSGLVEMPMTLTLDEIKARPSTSQYITLRCISNRIGGDLISTAKYTGLRLKDLLSEAVLKPEAKQLYLESVDGFYESVTMEDMMNEQTLLVYEMNDKPLPVTHGYPLRIYIPNHYGMKQPKWIAHMTAIDTERKGYWVERGWNEEAIVHTTSVIDNVTVEQSEGDTMLSGGIAYAGARGISKAELQVDDGPWNEVELRTPPLSQLTWVQWRYEDSIQPGRHVARIRAYDGNGDLQIAEESPPHPDGATGIYSYQFTV